ncbi:MAG: RsbRD N-terminal domain-containing protein [Desulfovibrio sp.]|jgi:hypothetical protein|nr:RsbRD N-terminal domain-containing protein [Desulfovibrio sp.]
MSGRRILPSEASLWPVFARRREEIARRWLERLYAAYPPKAAAFIASLADPFANPVGDRARRMAGAFVRVLASPRPGPEEREALAEALEDWMRLRAVQTPSPEEAVEAFFAMKAVLREFVPSCGEGGPAAGDLREAETRVDRVILEAFGSYVRCRETLLAIRAEEAGRRTAPVPPAARKAGGGRP